MKTEFNTIFISMDWIFETFKDNFKMNEISSHDKDAIKFIKQLHNEFKLKLIVTKNEILAAKWLIDNNAKNLVNCLVSEEKYGQLYLNDNCMKNCENFFKLYEAIIELRQQYSKHIKQ